MSRLQQTRVLPGHSGRDSQVCQGSFATTETFHVVASGQGEPQNVAAAHEESGECSGE